MTSLRTKLTVLVAIPLLILVVVAGAGVRNTSEGRQSAEHVVAHLQLALAADDATLALIQERRLTVSSPNSDGLSAQRSQTDDTLDALEGRLEVQQGKPGASDSDLQSAAETIADLPATRADIDGMSSTADVLDAYDEVLAPIMALDGSADLASDPAIAERQQAQRSLVRITNQVALEESYLHTAFSEQSLSPALHTQLTAVVAAEELWDEQFHQVAEPRQLEGYDQLSSSQSATEAGRLRDQILNDGPSEEIQGDDVVWATATDRKIEQLMTLSTDGATELERALSAENGESGQNRLRSYGLLIAALALLALAVYVLRRLVIQPIDRLAADSSEAADEIDSALESGDSQAIVPLQASGDEELDEVVEAFTTAQDAVATLVEERAQVRDEANEVFLNFGRRAQNLVTRQLSQIDDLEARTDEPDVLADLFLLDHLSTRLRRTAESLVLLAGSESPRPWARPVSVVNVIRAAAAETSDYSRVDLAEVGPGAVTGAVANDVSHLLAELIDNALTYSPPESRVSISGDRQPAGHYVISVSDAGLGMSTDQLAEANARVRAALASNGRLITLSDTTDAEDSSGVPLAKYFGLHVAGRIAARHGIDVKLSPSPSNGITAAIALPRTIMVLPTDGQSPALAQGPARQDASGPQQHEPQEPQEAQTAQAAREAQEAQLAQLRSLRGDPVPAAEPVGKHSAAPTPAPIPPAAAPPAPAAPPTPAPGTRTVRRRTVHPRSAIAMPAAGSQDD